MSAPNKLILVNQFGEESINSVEGDGVPLPGSANIILINGAGAPVNGTTGRNVAGKGSLYIRQDNGGLYSNTGNFTSPVWTLIGGGSSGGDVVGPSSSNDGQLALFSGTSGKLIEQLDADTDGYVVTQVSGKPAWAPASGGGGSPGGDPGSVQYNDSGSFGGFGLWDGTSFDLLGNIGVDDAHAFYFDNSGDANWRAGINLASSFSTPKLAGSKLMIQVNNDTGDGFAIGDGANPWLQIDTDKVMYVGNSIWLPNNTDFFTTGLIRFGTDADNSPQISNGSFAGQPRSMYLNGNAGGDTQWIFRDFNIPWLQLTGANAYFGKFDGTHSYTLRTSAGKSVDASYPLGMRFFTNVAGVDNVGSTPTPAHTFSIPAKAMAFNEDEIGNIEFAGVFAANTNAKQVDLELDGNILGSISGTTTTNGVPFLFKVSISRLSVTDWLASGFLSYGDLFQVINVAGTVTNWTSALDLGLVLTGVSNGDITANKSRGEYFSQGS